MSKVTIRVLGDDAERARAVLTEVAPTVRLVGAEEPAELVVMTAADLAELIEDAAATAAYHRTRDEETVPHELVCRLLDGDNPIKVWREHRGLSLTALADRAGIGKGYLSQIEAGERKGTIETMKKIAAALAVDLDDLT